MNVHDLLSGRILKCVRQVFGVLVHANFVNVSDKFAIPPLRDALSLMCSVIWCNFSSYFRQVCDHSAEEFSAFDEGY